MNWIMVGWIVIGLSGLWVLTMAACAVWFARYNNAEHDAAGRTAGTKESNIEGG